VISEATVARRAAEREGAAWEADWPRLFPLPPSSTRRKVAESDGGGSGRVHGGSGCVGWRA
jgi:hypothetical protein